MMRKAGPGRELRIVTALGARPQFVKAAMVSQAIGAHNATRPACAIRETLVHSGQHFDANLSQVFFDELGLPAPAVNLGISGGSHAQMTGRMIEAFEARLVADRPEWLLVYGDTNTTAAAAIAASKLDIPIAHVEAGLRSYNRAMPEEVNRIIADHLASCLFCPTRTAVENLQREGITDGVHEVGDVMYDAALLCRDLAETRSRILEKLGLQDVGYVLVTVHRAENTDDPRRLAQVTAGLSALAQMLPVVLPLHPRTRGRLAAGGLMGRLGRVRCIDPVSFLDMIRLEAAARVIVTDSGGVQKEAYFCGVPCVTLRDETEWVETVRCGRNQLVGSDPERLVAAVDAALRGIAPRDDQAEPYGDGTAAQRIVGVLAGDCGTARARA